MGGVGLEGRTPGNLIVIVGSKEINISNSSVKKTIFVRIVLVAAVVAVAVAFALALAVAAGGVQKAEGLWRRLKHSERAIPEEVHNEDEWLNMYVQTLDW